MVTKETTFLGLSCLYPIFRENKKTAQFCHFFLAITVEGKNPFRLPHFISFIQEAKNIIHVIIDA